MFHALHKVDMRASYAKQKTNLAYPYGGSLKNLILRRGGGGGGGLFTKNPIFRKRGGRGCQKTWAWTVCRFKRGLGKKERVVFLREVRYPNAHYEFVNFFKYRLIFIIFSF